MQTGRTYQQDFINMSSRIISIFLACAFLASCANKVAPEGGPKDTAPPKLIASKPENFSHSFSGNEITLLFDEYIQLINGDKQIILSPLPDEKPEISVRNKSISVKFKKPLQENTTYTLSFGNAIADVHESNSVNNFRFVFSTGNFLDSLSVSGNISDAYTLKPAGDVTVMLYSADDDSLPFYSRPDYITRTDAAGNFTFENLKAASFKLFALKDKNSNYLYDHPDELIAWADEPVRAGDSVSHALKLLRETPQQLKLLNVIVTEPVKAILIFNKPADIKLKDMSGVPSWHSLSFSHAADSVTVWLTDTLKDSLRVFVLQNNKLLDSVLISMRKPGSLKQRASVLQPLSVSAGSLIPEEKLVLHVSHPVAEVNNLQVKMICDTAETLLLSLRIKNPLTLESDFRLMSGRQCEVKLLPGSIKDIYGRTNDTLSIPLKTLSEKETGTLYLKLKNESPYPLIFSLVNENEQTIRDTVVSGDAPYVAFRFLPPGVFKMKVTEDSNQNGRWDTGNYLKKQKPERVSYFNEPVIIRANWEVEHFWKPEFK